MQAFRATRNRIAHSTRVPRRGISAGVSMVVVGAFMVTPALAGTSYATSSPENHLTNPYRLTLVARECDNYSDISANRSRNNLQETLQDLGVDSTYSSTMSNNPVAPWREGNPSAQVDNCRPIDDWTFTLGTGITGGTAAAPSRVTGAFREVRTSDTDMRDTAAGDYAAADGSSATAVTAAPVAGATTIDLTDAEAAKAAKGSLWVQGGKDALNQQLNQDEAVFSVGGTPKYSFASLRCVVDDLNGDNVEYVSLNSERRHGYCYAYYVDQTPKSGRIVVKKETNPSTTDSFKFTGNVSYNEDQSFNVTAGGSGTAFDRSAIGASDTTPPWWVDENARDGWSLTSVACVATNSRGATHSHWTIDDSRVAIDRLGSGDLVTCTYVNDKVVDPTPTPTPSETTPTVEPTPTETTPTVEPTPTETTPTVEPTPTETTPTVDPTPTETTPTAAPTESVTPTDSGTPTVVPTEGGSEGDDGVAPEAAAGGSPDNGSSLPHTGSPEGLRTSATLALLALMAGSVLVVAGRRPRRR